MAKSAGGPIPDPVQEAFTKMIMDQTNALFNSAQFVSSQMISFSQNGILSGFTDVQRKVLYENLIGAAALVQPAVRGAN